MADPAWVGLWAQAWHPMRTLHPHLLGHIRLTPTSHEGTTPPPVGGVIASVLPAYDRIFTAMGVVEEARGLEIRLPGSRSPTLRSHIRRTWTRAFSH